MKRALVVLVSTTAVLVGAMGVLYVLHRPTPGIPVFSYVGTSKSMADVEALAPPGWDVVSIASDQPLVGLHRPPASNARGKKHAYVVHFVGNGENALAEAAAFLVAADIPPAFGVLTVAPRGFDASRGTPSVDGLATDADRIVAHAIGDLGVDVERSIFSGFSMGALFAFRAAAFQKGRGPKAVVAFAPFAVVDVLPKAGPFARFLPLHRFDTLSVAKRSNVPALVVSGAKDRALDVTHHQRVITASPQATAMVVDADHAQVASHPQSLQAFRALLMKPDGEATPL